MPRQRWLSGTILATLLLTGCPSPAGKPVVSGDAITRTVTAGIVASNTGRLAGKVKGPDAASLISKAKFRLDATDDTLAAVAGAQVEVTDENGNAVSYGPVTTDSTGAFVFRKLKPSPPVLYLRVTYKAGDQPVSLGAIAVAPRKTPEIDVVVDPATSLVTKKTLVLLRTKAVNAAGVDARTAAKVATTLLPAMDDAALANALLHDDAAAAKDFDAFVNAHPDVGNAIEKLLGTSALAHLLDPTPEQGGATGAGGRQVVVTTQPIANTTAEADGTTRVAGGPKNGYADGPGPKALFDTPYDVATGPDGTLYVADSNNNAIRKIDVSGATPVVSTLAGGNSQGGYADGQGKDARLNAPSGVTMGIDGALYVADYGNHRIRRVALDGTVTTIAGTGTPAFADGPGDKARLSSPADLTGDGHGHLYVADTDNHRVRMIDLNDPTHPVTTVAGSGTQGLLDGPGDSAQLNGPQDVAVDGRGDVYVADTGNHAIRRIAMADPAHPVSTVAGNGTPGYLDGPGINARFNTPYGIAFGPAGVLYVADAYNNSVRLVDINGVVTTFWGDTSPDPAKPQGLFNQPAGVAIRKNAKGVVEVFIADANNHAIRKFALPAAQGTDGFNAK